MFKKTTLLLSTLFTITAVQANYNEDTFSDSFYWYGGDPMEATEESKIYCKHSGYSNLIYISKTLVNEKQDKWHIVYTCKK